MTHRDVQGVVVAFHGADGLDVSLAAVANEVSLIVVDNSSSSAVREVADSHRAEYIDPGENLGFGGGVNLALKELAYRPASDVLLLNPDAMLEPPALRLLAHRLHAPGNDRVAAIAPRLFDVDGHEQRVAWPFPSPARAWSEALGAGRLRSSATYVIGAVVLLRWEAIQDVGMFDERFFLYAEEADWQRRARSKGWTSQVCAEADATHVGAGTSTDRLQREILFHAAQEIYIRKWYGRLGWIVYRVAACSGAAGRAVVLRGDRRAEAARRARLYAEGPRRRAAQKR